MTGSQDKARSIFDLGHTLEHFVTTERISEAQRSKSIADACERVIALATALRDTYLVSEGGECESSSSARPVPSLTENNLNNLAGGVSRPVGGVTTPAHRAGATPPVENCPLCRRPQSVCDAAVAARLASRSTTPVARRAA